MGRNQDDSNKACGEVVYRITQREIMTSLGVTRETLLEIVEQGIVDPRQDEREEWLFDDESLRRIRTVLQLHRDLGVNIAGAGLALELMNEINRLRAMLR